LVTTPLQKKPELLTDKSVDKLVNIIFIIKIIIIILLTFILILFLLFLLPTIYHFIEVLYKVHQQGLNPGPFSSLLEPTTVTSQK